MQPRSKNRPEAKEKSGIEPDLVILGEGWRLLVEAEESKDYDAVQLIQQYVLSRTPSYQEKNRKTYQLLVSGSLGRPSGLHNDIRSSWEKHYENRTPCGGDYMDLIKHLLWIGWEEMEGLFRECALKVSKSEAVILLDTCEVLRAKGHTHVDAPKLSLEETGRLAKELQALINKIQTADSFPEDVLELIVQEHTIIESLIQSFHSAERLQLDSNPGLLKLLRQLVEVLEHANG